MNFWQEPSTGEIKRVFKACVWVCQSFVISTESHIQLTDKLNYFSTHILVYL